jgi:hypothetical protein
MEKSDIKQITEEVWRIILELSQTNDYEFPYRIPPLCDRASKVIEDMKQMEAEFAD